MPLTKVTTVVLACDFCTNTEALVTGTPFPLADEWPAAKAWSFIDRTPLGKPTATLCGDCTASYPWLRSRAIADLLDADAL